MVLTWRHQDDGHHDEGEDDEDDEQGDEDAAPVPLGRVAPNQLLINTTHTHTPVKHEGLRNTKELCQSKMAAQWLVSPRRFYVSS